MDDIDNGRVDYPDRRQGSVATYTCNRDFLLSGESSRTCEDGVWSGKEPTCERKNHQNMIVMKYRGYCFTGFLVMFPRMHELRKSYLQQEELNLVSKSNAQYT